MGGHYRRSGEAPFPQWLQNTNYILSLAWEGERRMAEGAHLCPLICDCVSRETMDSRAVLTAEDLPRKHRAFHS